jgi:phosphoglycolate phosphatase-like HAD superfamily hydrolase
MQLIIFDIDGTLTQTTVVDDECYVWALNDVFGVTSINPNWAQYDHCTDIAIAAQIIRERLGREPAERDFARLRDRFVEHLIAAHHRSSSLYQPTRGALDTWHGLTQHTRFAVALATGGFEASARWKLSTAGIPADGIPAGFAEDGPSREEVMLTALERARRKHGCEQFSNVVYVGDGVWDVRACANLKIPFIGVGSGERETALRSAGAELVLPDLTGLLVLLEAMPGRVGGAKPDETGHGPILGTV